MTEPMVPVPYRVAGRVVETADSVSLRLEPHGKPLPEAKLGQFMMLYCHGVGEVAISVSGPGPTHTIRAVGAVSRALHDLRPGTLVGVRGPFGTSWDVEDAAGNDIVIVAGGAGLCPLRPVLADVLDHRGGYGRVVVVAGARKPDEFLFPHELASWAGRHDVELLQTIDRPAPGWTGPVGFVTEPLAALELDPERTRAFLCGPEPMMRACAEILLAKQMSAHHIRVSLERAMKCGIGLCGHCQLGPLLVCRDGPVMDYTVAGPLLAVKEL
ncbi:MAG TPA: FAD/NAD(P)-binding protein [Amycolatopsis sp.]|uniref:FAD/NAD(P)-binding protein n=1 Tax=Amycolatopsis nalaikhensis TaxID=715472 RepID=A0ABY8XEC5_9PSEU|nr:FAD/NAD(P)-binding protein [Amycolatopsis sp. 2-2]WIV53966.1 FAD/NAD(P)-binding protein [Amycolatopsis sp. 2-2]HWD02978.1 FAD/NAD(P)-binding protein [Amycolatopsis sp.]